MYTLIKWNIKTGLLEKPEMIDFREMRDDHENFYWLDFCEHDDAEEKKILAQQFQINSLAISDAQRNRHPPKFEHFEVAEFLLLKAFTDKPETYDIETRQLAMFFTDNYLITRHKESVAIIDELREEFLSNSKYLKNAPIYLALNLSRRCASSYTTKLLEIEDRLEVLEDAMYHHPDDHLLTELVSHKTYLRRLKRILSYHKAVLRDMDHAFEDHPDKNVMHPLTDAYEHFERGFSLSALYYDMAADLIDGYISVASHRLNQIMKILTIITAIFVPLSFVAGLYGMNFEYMPELKIKYGYFIILALMFSLAGVLLYIFRKNKWL